MDLYTFDYMENENNRNIQLPNAEVERFFNHLNEESNDKIIFSAPYGVGKTTFLEEVANKENNSKYENANKFEFFHLYPVNYSVANNEDIFQYIKYDLIYCLIEKGVKFEDADLFGNEKLKVFLKKNIHTIASKLLYFVPIVGKELVSLFDELDALKDKLVVAFEDDIKNEEQNLEKLLQLLENKTGSIYEIDIFTQIINNVLKRIKNNSKFLIESQIISTSLSNQTKKNVLIIDDLDRIDPNHIFRLLNIFSAHIDYKTDKNKFGFDKIIFVCDIQNIRKIFIHKYGIDTDFNGYIDKFYSKEIYHFYNYEALSNTVKSKVSDKFLNNEIMFYDVDKRFISDILYEMIVNNKLNYRTVLKIDEQKFRTSLKFEYETSIQANFKKCYFWKIALFFYTMFGDFQIMSDSFESMDAIFCKNDDKVTKIDNEQYNLYYNKYLSPIIHYKNHKWDVNTKFTIPTTAVKCSIMGNSHNGWYSELDPGNNYPNCEKFFWRDIKKALEILKVHNTF